MPPPAPTAKGKAWQERELRQDDQWRLATSGMRQEMAQLAALQHQYLSDQNSMLLDAVQQRVTEAWQLHGCTHLPADRCSSACLEEVSMGTVMYWALTCHGTLNVPVIHCKACDCTFSPSPAQAGCFPSTPTVAHAWYDIVLLGAYRHFGLLQGVGGTGELVQHTQSMEYDYAWSASSAPSELLSFHRMCRVPSWPCQCAMPVPW